jgi:uncharacterized spore protein YtfJ
MIDPKLNELPVDAEGDFANRPESTLTEEEKARRLKQMQAGLSVTDTVAGDTLLSDGSRGVDVSGVRAGAGAGAGSTAVTPSANAPANTDIVGGPRGTGMDYRTDSDKKDHR